MCWYKKLFLFVSGVIALAGVQSCKSDSHAGSDTRQFFDLKGFFHADSGRLAKLNPLVNKTVTHNDSSQTKKVHIENWGNELSLFIGSDINKAAWKASYSSQISADFMIYKAKDPSLRTRDIIIKRDGNKVKWILIFNHIKNPLYETEEKLSYYPDSLYIIQKLQHVRLMGPQKYVIRGSFN